MTILRPNAFLFGVAFVSFYLALTGCLRARHRAAAPVLTDWLSASIMALVAVIIGLWAFPLARAGDAKGTGLLTFAAVGRSWQPWTCLPSGLTGIKVSCGLLLT